MKYLALLRGINVGGNNIIKMAALKSCFERMGFDGVETFIQSGNVIFSSSENDAELLCKKIEKILSKEFGYTACVVLVKQRDLKRMVEAAPKGFGAEPAIYRYNVLFLKKPVVAKQVMKEIPWKEGVDEIRAGSGVLYFSILISRATQSRISRIVALPVYKLMTIRNWNTTQKLSALMEK